MSSASLPSFVARVDLGANGAERPWARMLWRKLGNAAKLWSEAHGCQGRARQLQGSDFKVQRSGTIGMPPSSRPRSTRERRQGPRLTCTRPAKAAAWQASAAAMAHWRGQQSGLCVQRQW